MKIRNVVFDIGNVLADYRWYGFLQDKGFSPEMIDRIARCSTLHPAWNEFDRGVLSSEEVVEGFIRLDPEIADELHRAFDDLSDLLRMFSYSVPWIEKLKTAGYSVYYLSNFSRRALRDCPEALGFLPYMNGGIFSCDVKLLKPEPAIYHDVLKGLEVEPQEAVFFDDMAVNVEAACTLGIHGLLWRGLEQAKADFQQIVEKYGR